MGGGAEGGDGEGGGDGGDGDGDGEGRRCWWGGGVEARVEAAGARCLPQPRPLMREQVAERYAAAAGEEREQDPEEDDHPVRRQARHEQGRRRGRVL